MNERGKSDRPVVPKKRPNKGREWSGQGELYTGTKVETPDTAKSEPKARPRRRAEVVEGRGLVKGNSPSQNTSQAQYWLFGVTSARERIRKAAAKDTRLQFTTLMHHIYNVDTLREAYFSLERNAAPGVDGVTWQSYGEALEDNLKDLSSRLGRGAYRASPVRRTYIKKADGRDRPLGVTTLEDKVAQRATVIVLNAIYEQDFLGFSYGFREGRNQHNALDAVSVGLERRQVNWVLDADIRGFFDAIDHECLMKLVARRVKDERVLRLIRKWLNAGVLEDGVKRQVEEGTPQGGVISPLLANIYLHYVLDVWAHDWRRRWNVELIIVRYADDFVVGFASRKDAVRFQEHLAHRLGEYHLELHPDKTRLIEFGRYASRDRKSRGDRKPETFDFLGFTHICGKTRKGWFQVQRRTSRKKATAKLKELKGELRRRWHRSTAENGLWLASVLTGHYRYYCVPGNRCPRSFYMAVTRLWKRALSRRGQKGEVTWKRMLLIAKRWLPSPIVCHPYPNQRLVVKT